MIRLTTHASEMMAERDILFDWVAETVSRPDYRTADPREARLTRSFEKILPAQGRMLRVVHRPDGAEALVIAAHSDRGARQ